MGDSSSSAEGRTCKYYRHLDYPSESSQATEIYAVGHIDFDFHNNNFKTLPKYSK